MCKVYNVVPDNIVGKHIHTDSQLKHLSCEMGTRFNFKCLVAQQKPVVNVSRTREGWEWDSEYLQSRIQGPGLLLKIKGLMLVGAWATVC